MAWLVTFTCYGTHLPGDRRGSFDHVRAGERRFLAPNAELRAYCRREMKQQAYFLTAPECRTAVRDAIVGVCAFRSWPLLALHVRVTHVHGVVETEASPSQILQTWKGYATRSLRVAGLVGADRVIWTHGGNGLRITSPERLRAAIRYVLEEQGEPMERYWANLPPPSQAGLADR